MSQFVRFAGCNLRCPGWPCDTPQAIKPELFAKEQRLVSSSQLTDEILEEHRRTGTTNIVFTGGEPLLQHQNELATIVDLLDEDFNFEVFTNGTVSISLFLSTRCSFVMDWKLPGSGENQINRQRIANLVALNSAKNSIKFVVATRQDLLIAHELYEEFLKDSEAKVFVGAAWDKYSNQEIVKYVKEHQLPWRLNVQVQNYVFGVQRRFT
jgi:organic radical activating enzyme